MAAGHACPVCTTPVPEGASRCPACKAVFGEDNRCDGCNALSAIKPGKKGGYVCMACNAPRQRHEGTIVEEAKGVPIRAQAAAGAGAQTALTGVGLGIGGLMSIAALTAFIFVPGIGGMAVGAGLLLGGIGAFMGFRSAAKKTRAHTDKRLSENVARSLKTLASKQGGVVTAADAARALNIDEARADEAMTELARQGDRVSVEVTDEGQIEYHFLEITRAQSHVPKVRVKPTIDEQFEALEAQEKAADEKLRR